MKNQHHDVNVIKNGATFFIVFILCLFLEVEVDFLSRTSHSEVHRHFHLLEMFFFLQTHCPI